MAQRYIKIFLDWMEATAELTHEEKGRLIDALVAYANGKDCTLTGNERIVFPLFRLQLDRDSEEYDAVVERNRKNGSKGGRPKKTQETFSETQNNPENPMGFSETQKSQDKDKDEDKDKDKGVQGEPAPKRKRFTPPTLEELTKYIWEHSYNVNPQRFLDHYESNGWMVGRNHMKDWRAAVRNWNSKAPPIPRNDSADLSYD